MNFRRMGGGGGGHEGLSCRVHRRWGYMRTGVNILVALETAEKFAIMYLVPCMVKGGSGCVPSSGSKEVMNK